MRQVGSAPPRDPAPSRLSYRMQRLWLTPVYRRAVRTGIPLAVMALAVGWFLNDADRKAAITNALAEARRSVEERPEFMVQMMAVDGATAPVAEAIRGEVPLDFPLSSFDMDLEAIRAKVESLSPVRKARVMIAPGGVLRIDVDERIPVVVWRTENGLILVDETGETVAGIAARSDRADLPVVAGTGADKHVTEALEIWQAAGPLHARMRGLLRMGERRWDVVLDRGQTIMLPEEAPVAALQRVIALDKAQDMLGRDLSVVDIRNPRRPTLRMAENAVEELRKIRGIEGDMGSQ
ncbi:cell division protein FtsQ/DivIB [Alphaproteobacteria bacterium KMM 3653]|uniref:Cell division protein FtsQ n=1 Tax=Harenicola maris TaxID=2841044 RepID=A0AAP2G2Q7_9RHOB|nr:cell division protein FtsQ/DivIB [Harenicola maris]